ncbi:MAG: 50S ribosomal protein L29 [Syntrophobacteraceae bacterium]
MLQKMNELQEAKFNLKFQHATGQLENTAQLPKNKKDLARIMTILSEMDKKAVA